MTEQINGPCLMDFLAKSWASLEKTHRHDLSMRPGSLFRTPISGMCTKSKEPTRWMRHLIWG
jgi:hypothetical protein